MNASVDIVVASVAELPVPISNYPYWIVLFRPEPYAAERIPSLTECSKLVERTRVQLRGWDFPHLALRDDANNGRVLGSHSVGSWTNFMGSIEYWELFQSGQFVHIAAVREATEPQWRTKLEGQAMNHLRHLTDLEWDAVPGYISLVNLIYTITEYFEFAARICQAGVYRGSVSIELGLRGIRGFVLTTEWNRAWSEYRVASSDELSNSWKIASDTLISGSAEHSLKAIVWVCECFGWMSPNLDSLRSDQYKFLTRQH